MLRPPYLNFPFPFYRNYPRTPPYGIHQSNITNSPNSIKSPPSSLSNTSSNSFSSIRLKDLSNNEYFTPNDSSAKSSVSHQRLYEVKNKNKSNKNTDDYLFDLFGLKIYSDDVLLMSLIYFLYSEEVKDDGLFIVLILLLLS